MRPNLEIRVSGWCQVDLWQLTFDREALLRNNVGLLKLLVGEYRSEQTFKRRERERKKSHACQPLLGAVASISVFNFPWGEGGLLLKVPNVVSLKNASALAEYPPGPVFSHTRCFVYFFWRGVILRMEPRIVGKGSYSSPGKPYKTLVLFLFL